MKTGRRFLLAAAAASAVAATVAAQGDGWLGKPYQQWTKGEVQKVLSDSPWARTVMQSGPVVSVGGNAAGTSDKVYVAQLRSAMPVRHALLRLRQLNEKYDSMSDKKKAEFDERNRPLVECPACAENYVVSLIPPTSAVNTRTVTLPAMKPHVRLLDERGRKRELVHFTPAKGPGQEIIFFFPRLDERGEPLVTPASKKLIFTIDTNVLGLDATTTRFEFDLPKMIRDGRVEF
ncbi:MAG TPA: hypothetical protein VK421_14860 [Pyrinomonadaceae bacterium]|nr:hypothetical protein [Pyrinomonadaceae bacterium]